MFVLGAQDAEVGIRCLRGFQLRFGLRHRFVGVYSGFIQNFGEVQRFLVGDYGGIEQLLEIILAAKLVIIHGDFRLSGQASVFQIRRAGLRGSYVGTNLLRTRPHRSGTHVASNGKL